MLDIYSLKARAYPLILTFLPFLVLGLAFSFKYESIVSSVSSFGLIGLLSFLFAQLGRDLGKKKEKDLWKLWGGPPTTTIWLNSTEYLDESTKKRYRDSLNKLCPINEEDNFLKIQTWTKYLISQTRNTSKFNLLFKENVNYGFRRNTLGLKPIAISVALFSVVAAYVYSALKYDSFNLFSFSKEFWISTCLNFVLIILWALIVTKEWVKIPAYSYAQRLFETTEILASEIL